MYTERNSNKNTAVINVLIYADEQDVLWNYRNLVYDLKEKCFYKINLILTGNSSTVLELMKFQQGGIDIYLSDCRKGTDWWKDLAGQIRIRHPECQIIWKTEVGYYYQYLSINGVYMQEVWGLEEDLKHQLMSVIRSVRGK